MADKPIRVTILRPGRRKFFVARWTDPETGRESEKSTGHVNRRDAERWAAKLEADLNAGGIAKRIKWDAFRDRVKLDYLPERRPATRVTYTSALNALEQIVKPKLVSGVDTAAIDKFKATLRARGASEPTIASYMRALRAVMRWGHARGIVRSVPKFDMPPGASAIAGGKPLNDLQCLKLLAACKRVVGPERAPEWKRLVGGLLASGLRVGEAWALSWDDFSGPHVLLNRAKPMLVIPAASQKSGRDTITPIVPEFLAILESTPKGERTGPVFRAAGSDGKRPSWTR